MKTLAFVFGLCIAAVGLTGIIAPSVLLSLARTFASSGAGGFYLIAAVRIAFGITLIGVAAASRAPKPLRILGYVIVLLGIASGLAGLLAAQRADNAITWWLHQSSAVLRLTAAVVLALGAFVAYACAPARRAG